MSNVRLLRLLTGEDIIAEVVRSDDKVVKVKNPVRVLIMENKAGFVKWIEMTNDTEVTLAPFHVVAMVGVIPQMLDQYNRAFSKIVAPTNGLILPK